MPNEKDTPPSASDALLRRPDPRRARQPVSPAATLLQNFFVAMNAADDDAEEQYRRALADLRREAELVVVEIARAQGDCTVRDYPTRWAHVHAAAELRHPAALPFLRNLVMTPIPPEESPDPHSFSSVGEETILRTTAVEGIGYLARERADAAEALFDALKQPSLSIRRAAVQSLLATSRGRRLQARIRKALPEEQQFLVDLKAVEIGDVPQVRRPERYLSEAGRRGGIAPAPSLPDDEAGSRTDNKAPRRKG